MNDQEFIELLNLYVDREIGTQDAMRLEAEVASDPRRRRIYDQYCRIQKACTKLSEEFPVEHPDSNIVAFPRTRQWRLGPVFAGLAAAAACGVLLFGVRNHGVDASPGAVAADPAPARTVADTVDLTATPESMKPVFFARLPSDQSAKGAPHSMFADAVAPSQVAQLNWIGDIHMQPVLSAAGPDFLLNPRTDLRAAALSDPAGRGDFQEPAEMAAFRFQR